MSKGLYVLRVKSLEELGLFSKTQETFSHFCWFQLHLNHGQLTLNCMENYLHSL